MTVSLPPNKGILSQALNYPSSLPIAVNREEIVAAIRGNQVVIVSGETGSGKTTQLPKMCIEAGFGSRGRIGCTQPRRIAALSVSRRLAEELEVEWGREVGCKIRFTDKTSPQTVIKVMTDGILLAETRSDPLLKSYDAIIIDEAHERSLNIDFLLGYLKSLLVKRPDLRVIITSATIDTEHFSKAFGGAPVFEVSGRLFPVKVRYAPLVSEDTDDEEEESGEMSFIDGAVRAVKSLVSESREGDLLVFMPTERDILETKEKLSGHYGSVISVLPLMGSMSAPDQERIFKFSPNRKIIVATNIAETSLTIPSIRYVVDTGLARISRYNARTRTKRLPVERISKSSANQRTGRAGRVRDGVCVRLYSESEYDSRPDYTDPEILRANLAEVILRMKAFKLGEIEDFPFLNPPEPRSVRSGYMLLQELGALDADNHLTGIGRELATLPVDPTVGRMLLQSRRERALPEVAVIVAGLSVQDPRQRPLEKREKADEAHRLFVHPDSDFLTLLNIWNAFHQEAATGKIQSQLRKFCKTHFLSFLRMREWMDVHRELLEMVTDRDRRGTVADQSIPVLDASAIKRFDGNYRAIHRAILCGLLGQVGYRIDRDLYRVTSGREVLLAPGSSLSERRGKQFGGKQERRSSGSSRGEHWIVAGEIVETANLYARMVASVAPSWIEEIGRHLTKRTIEEPHFSVSSGNVTARERITLYGLNIAYRKVNFARIDPDGAKELFIIHALVPDDSPLEYSFVKFNRKLCDKLGSRLARLGRFNREALERSLIDFYKRKLPPMASTLELERFVKEDLPLAPQCLNATADELLDFLGMGSLPVDSHLFPDHIEIAGVFVDIHYRYDPSGQRDGATLSMPLKLARQIPVRMFEGAIPGLRELQVPYLLRSLSKEFRSRLPKLEDVGEMLIQSPTFSERPLVASIVEGIREAYGVDIPTDEIRYSALPDHLRPRVEVVDGDAVIASGRDIAAIQRALPVEDGGTELAAVTRTKEEWEKRDIGMSEFHGLPEAVEAARISGVPLYLYPALINEGGRVAIRLLEEKRNAVRESLPGADLLLRKHLSTEVRTLEREAAAVEVLKPLLVLYSTIDRLKTEVVAAALRVMFAREHRYPVTRSDLEDAAAVARSRMFGLVSSIVSWVKPCLELRRTIISVKTPYPGMRAELDELLPPDFVVTTPYEQLQHMSRYLKAMLVRAERFDTAPGKDRLKAQLVAPYQEALRSVTAIETREHLRWMIEEFKVSVFAQELGTARPVSAARLDKLFGNPDSMTEANR